jgi:diguanylate cyclase (GGDEF)-like protein
MSKFVIQKFGEGWEFAREGAFTKMVFRMRTSREKFREKQEHQILEEHRTATLTEESLAEYERAVFLDQLTGLYNSRSFVRKLSHELRRDKRYKRPFSLMVLSIDRLQDYEKQFGTMTANDLLKAIAMTVLGSIRDTDIASRIAYNHFAVIFPETYSSMAVVVAERIREKLAQLPLNNDWRSLKVTASLGVVAFPTHGRDEADLVEKVLHFHGLAQQDGGDKVFSG